MPDVNFVKKSVNDLTFNLLRIKAIYLDLELSERGRRGRDHMVVGFITTYAFLLPLML